MVAVAGEDPFGDLAQGFFVLDEQNGLPGGDQLAGRCLLDRRGDLVGSRSPPAPRAPGDDPAGRSERRDRGT